MANYSELVWIASLVHLRFVICNLRLNVNLNMQICRVRIFGFNTFPERNRDVKRVTCEKCTVHLYNGVQQINVNLARQYNFWFSLRLLAFKPLG